MDKQKVHVKQTGLKRLVLAFGYSMHGFRSGWSEPAFRQEAIAAFLLLPLAWWLGNTWLERAILAGVVVAVMVVELLNTAMEATVDRVGLELHPLSKKAKDLGSAAVLLSLGFGGSVWAAAIWQRLFGA